MREVEDNKGRTRTWISTGNESIVLLSPISVLSPFVRLIK